MKNASSLLN